MTRWGLFQLCGVLSAVVVGITAGITACSTLPEKTHKNFSFPKNASLDSADRPHETLGLVRSKAEFDTLDPDHDEKHLCKNYYNRAVSDLIRIAKQRGADAVVDVRSVVFYEDGNHQLFKTPECSDDGAEGQVLTQGIAVKWKPLELTEIKK